MSLPAVSAIVPVFDGRERLRAALEGVRAQTLPPCELLVVDDGSRDGSLAALDGFTAPFPVRVERQENRGQSAARNRGAALAAGELLAFLDQDDVWLPEHLAILVPPFARDPRLGWAYSDFDEIDAAGAVVTRSFLRQFGVRHPKRTIGECVAADLMVLPSASVLRRDAFRELGGFDEALCGYEDDDLFVRCFRAGWEHRFQPQSTLRFRIHAGSSSGSRRFLASRLLYAEKLARLLPDDPRLGRYYLRRMVAPRFFFNTLDDYVRACSARDWETARLALAALRRFARERRGGVLLAGKMAAAASPRLFRLLLTCHERLPRPLRSRNPLLHLRPSVGS